MRYYIAIGDLQDYLKKHHEIYGHASTMQDLITALICQNAMKAELPVQKLPDWGDYLTDEEYIYYFDQQYMDFSDIGRSVNKNAREDLIIPDGRDVYATKHLRYLNNGGLHSHDFFEMNYVFQGTCCFYFKKEVHMMQNGELCIIAPESPHDITVSDDSSVIITITIRKSTFHATFLDLLSQNNIVSLFFRSNFSANAQHNYLLFFTSQERSIRSIIRNLTLELWKTDSFSNMCSINWIHILLTFVLRHHSDTVLYYNFQAHENFALILHYIQRHYQNLTLANLAEFFHYTDPYLSSLIHQNTGVTYSELIKNLRIRQAKKYLANTNMKVSEIAEKIGYHTVDHFTKIFRAETGMTPTLYRKNNTN